MNELFAHIVTELDLIEQYSLAKASFEDSGKLSELLMITPLENSLLVDQGEVLVSSLEDVVRTSKATDKLYDYLNNNLDTLPDADKLISALLDTEIVSIDRFQPSFIAYPGDGPGLVNITSCSVDLVISLTGSQKLLLTPDMDFEDILDEENAPTMETERYIGKVLIHDRGDRAVTFVPFVETTVEALDTSEVEIPTPATSQVSSDVS